MYRPFHEPQIYLISYRHTEKVEKQLKDEKEAVRAERERVKELEVIFLRNVCSLFSL